MRVSDNDEEISLKIRATTPRKLDRQQYESCGTGRGWHDVRIGASQAALG
jgi:hypothetical protein